MVLTLFLLGLVYAVLIGVLIAAGARGALLIGVVAGALFLFSSSPRTRSRCLSMGAREVSPAAGPAASRDHRSALRAGEPAQASRGDRRHRDAQRLRRRPLAQTATVCATTGILQLLTPVELEAVLGHELTHVQNRDVMVMTVASFFASIASFIVQIGFWFGGVFDDENEGAGALVLGSGPGLGGGLRGLLAPAPGAVPLPRVRSRSGLGDHHRPAQRADLGAAEDQRHDAERSPARPSGGPGEMAAFYIVPPKAKQTVASLFSTHPPLEARIAALQRFEAQLQGTGR